uniref:Uncharacterized protein n=1 Tax=Mycena chlorophos TaxID=658473 RepID=A0ABQ0L6D6_MYCCL|nr:predicted protein [Mycena chlorophos]
MTSEAPATVSLKEEDDEFPWKSSLQLVRFRDLSKAVAADYLKQKGITFSNIKQKSIVELKIKDAEAWKAYTRGEADAKKIDVRRRKIKDAEMD